jgi:teichuronic acid exporter
MDTAVPFRSRVLSAVRWSAGAKLASQSLSWVITIVVIRLLRPEDYGLMAMATIFVGLLTLFNELGLGAAIIQRPSIDDTLIRQAFGLILLSNAACAVLLGVGAPFIAMFFDEPRLVLLMRVLALQFVIVAFSVVPQSLLERELSFKRRSLADLVSTTIGALATLMLAFLGHGVWALVWGNLAQLSSNMVLVNLARPYLRWPSFKLAGLRDVATFGGYVSMARLLWYFYAQADIFIGGRLLGHELLGLYAVARQLAWLPMEKLTVLVAQVALPAFARVQGDRERVASYLRMSVRTVSFVLFPVCFGLSAIAPELITLFLGEQWHSSIVPLQLLCLVIPLRIISNMTNPAIQALARADTVFVNLLVSALIMPAAFVVGCRWGIVGLSAAWLVGFPLVFVIRLPWSLEAFGMRASDFLRAMGRPAFGSCCMYAVVWTARLLSPFETASAAQLLLLVAVGAAAYATLVGAANRHGYREVFALVRG